MHISWLIIIAAVIILIAFALALSVSGTRADRDYGRDDEARKIPPAR